MLAVRGRVVPHVVVPYFEFTAKRPALYPASIMLTVVLRDYIVQDLPRRALNIDTSSVASRGIAGNNVVYDLGRAAFKKHAAAVISLYYVITNLGGTCPGVYSSFQVIFYYVVFDRRGPYAAIIINSAYAVSVGIGYGKALDRALLVGTAG